MKISQHLSELHKASAACHGALADAHSRAAEDTTDAVSKAFHKAAGAAHSDQAAFHKDCYDALTSGKKSVESDDLEKVLSTLVPDNVRVVGDPSATNGTTLEKRGDGPTLVPRPGQNLEDVKNVPPGLRHLVSA